MKVTAPSAAAAMGQWVGHDRFWCMDCNGRGRMRRARHGPSLAAVRSLTRLVDGLLKSKLSGGGVLFFVGCLSHLTIDHASLSRRSTVPTPSRHFGCSLRFFHVLHRNICFVLSPSGVIANLWVPKG